MATKKDTYQYIVKSGSRTVYVGITSDLARRAAEHRRRWPAATISKVGRAATREQAIAWEARTVKSLGPSTAASLKSHRPLSVDIQAQEPRRIRASDRQSRRSRLG